MKINVDGRPKNERKIMHLGADEEMGVSMHTGTVNMLSF